MRWKQKRWLWVWLAILCLCAPPVFAAKDDIMAIDGEIKAGIVVAGGAIITIITLCHRYRQNAARRVHIEDQLIAYPGPAPSEMIVEVPTDEHF